MTVILVYHFNNSWLHQQISYLTLYVSSELEHGRNMKKIFAIRLDCCVGLCVLWSERGVISAESFYHPLRRVWHGQDGAETTVMHGEWTTSQRSEWTFQRRRQLVHVIRSVSVSFIDGLHDCARRWGRNCRLRDYIT